MTDTASMPCTVCAKQIPKNAKKCTECGEFQSTLARIAQSIDLTALLGLLPLITLIYAFLADRLEVARSDLHVTPVSCQKEAATLFASNSGNRTALLQRATFAATGDAESEFSLPEDLSQRVFAAGEARLFELNVDRRRNPAGLASFQSLQRADCNVALRFEILEYDHTITNEERTCACPSS